MIAGGRAQRTPPAIIHLQLTPKGVTDRAPATLFGVDGVQHFGFRGWRYADPRLLPDNPSGMKTDGHGTQTPSWNSAFVLTIESFDRL